MKITFLVVLLLLPILSFAESEEAVMPKTGTLAATTNVPVGQATQDGPAGGNSLDEATVNPLTASVSRVADGEYEYKVFNNSEDQYTVSLDLIAKDADGRTVRRGASSASLSAGKSVTRTMRVPSNTANVSIEMRNWKKRSRVVSNEEILAEIEKKKEEIRALEATLTTTDTLPTTPTTEVQ